MIKSIKNSELATVAAIYIKKHPDYCEEILSLVISTTARDKAIADFDVAFKDLILQDVNESAKTCARNLFKVTTSNKLLYDYFITSKSHVNKLKERMTLVEEAELLSEFKQSERICSELDNLGIKVPRVLKLQYKIEKADGEFFEKLADIRTKLGPESLPYFREQKDG